MRGGQAGNLAGQAALFQPTCHHATKRRTHLENLGDSRGRLLGKHEQEIPGIVEHGLIHTKVNVPDVLPVVLGGQAAVGPHPGEQGRAAGPTPGSGAGRPR